MEPLRFVFGIHVHQPVGNFHHVFEEHVRDVYLPFLSAVAERDFTPIALHVSGPLLEWLEDHDSRYLDLIGRLAADGRLELLLAGFYEPILIAIPREDRLQQIGWMREALHARFGIDATTLWLTERVWEPGLPADLVHAGVECLLVDDRHFLVTGFERDDLHAPYRTDSDGRTVVVLPIDERLRYLIPFQPPSDTAAYLRGLRESGRPLAVFADDGEKFGGWPGTKAWVYERGWLASFFETVGRLVDEQVVRLVTPSQAWREVESAGLAYLPTASYREMEGWSLPPGAATRLERIETEWGEDRINGADGALLRGSHWRNFLAKYPESNRMHKKALHLSQLCRERGDPAAVRRDIGRAQCNDAYWHGVFGGLYLPHLRAGLWRHLARAESRLRAGEPLAFDVLDLHGDGHDELWIHSEAFSAVVSPRRGGAIEEYTLFRNEVNYADTLTRRTEAYHRTVPHGQASDAVAPGDNAEQHGITLHESPPRDHHDRALLVDRVIGHDLGEAEYARADYVPVASWMASPTTFEVTRENDALLVSLVPVDDHRLIRKELRFATGGHLTVRYTWRPEAFPPHCWFAPEISVSADPSLVCTPSATVWRYPISTLAKSERGLEETVQGLSYTPLWPVELGEASFTLF
jgi:alpha-amylase/alpha-mannosidase (GH57 family)